MTTVAASASRLTIWPKRWLFLAIAIAGLPVARSFGLSWFHAALAVAGLLLLIEGLLRQLCAGRLRQLEREVARAIQQGEEQQLMPLYRDAHLLRFAGPRDEVLGTLGLIHQRLGNHRAAADALRDALEEATPKRVPLLAHRLADTLYASEHWTEAERFYRLSQDEQRQRINAGVQARIARLIRQRQGDPDEAEQYLRRAVEAAKGRPGCGLFRCQLVELLAAAGKHEDAQWQLSIAEEELADGDEDDRARLEQARAALSSATSPP